MTGPNHTDPSGTAAASSLGPPESDGTLRLSLSGRLDGGAVAPIWQTTLDRIGQVREQASELIIDCGGVSYCDGAGAALIIDVARHWQGESACDTESSRGFRVEQLAPEYQRLLDQYNPAEFLAPCPGAGPDKPIIEELGEWLAGLYSDFRVFVSYFGELTAAMAQVVRQPGRVRWGDVWLVAERTGANAMPIVVLIGFLLGLVLAFQSAIPMRQFGAEIFVADLIGISMVRELGPLVTAIVVAGRTGSSFAAELGTMKVNEELNALETMGLSPVRFLVVTRVLAGMAVTPLLALYGTFAGLLGGLVVFLTLGFPVVTYVNQLKGAVEYGDLMGGLFKALVFGLLVSAIGCLRGLQTQSGASAVGISTTRAVVSAIILVAIADAIFSILFYVLGI